jgi:uncharacterized protein YbjQ (UPF0145 family)
MTPLNKKENKKEIIKKNKNDQDEPKYDPSLVSTTPDFDENKYVQLGVVVGSATQGISITRTFFSGLRAMAGSRVTNVEELFTRGFGFAVQHMIKNAYVQYPKFAKIVGLFWSMTALNPESISIMVTGTAIGHNSRGGIRKTKRRAVNRRKRKTIRL